VLIIVNNNNPSFLLEMYLVSELFERVQLFWLQTLYQLLIVHYVFVMHIHICLP